MKQAKTPMNSSITYFITVRRAKESADQCPILLSLFDDSLQQG